MRRNRRRGPSKDIELFQIGTPTLVQESDRGKSEQQLQTPQTLQLTQNSLPSSTTQGQQMPPDLSSSTPISFSDLAVESAMNFV